MEFVLAGIMETRRRSCATSKRLYTRSHDRLIQKGFCNLLLSNAIQEKVAIADRYKAALVDAQQEFVDKAQGKIDGVVYKAEDIRLG